jgi:hypothetical protein
MFSFDILSSYLNLGFQHIVNVDGFDHILFILTLCAVYRISEWRKIGIVITAFTVGHSITLAMAALKIIFPNRHLIEFLIPVTILLSGVFNMVFYKVHSESTRQYTKYFLGLFFGLIHGMSFSNFFIDLMGDSSKIIFPLFAFNVGLEIGQLFIIFLYFLCISLLLKSARVSYRRIAQLFSLAGIAVSVYLIFVRV